MWYTIMCLELFVCLFAILTFAFRYMRTLLFHSKEIDNSYDVYKHSKKYHISFEIKLSLLIGTIIMMIISLFLFTWFSLLLVLIFLGLQTVFCYTLFD